MAEPLSSRSPAGPRYDEAPGSKSNLDRRKTSNSLQRAVREAEVQQGASVRHWLNLGGYFASGNTKHRSHTYRQIAKRACTRSYELRQRSASLIVKSRGLRERIKSKRTNSASRQPAATYLRVQRGKKILRTPPLGSLE